MAPQEINVTVGTKRSQAADPFSFPFPKKRKKNRKKKANSARPNQPNGHPKKEAAIEVITLDSDDSHDKSEKFDDDVVLLENPVPKIDLDHFESIDDCDFIASDIEENNIVINIVDPIPPPETPVSNVSKLPPEPEGYRPRLDYPKTWTKEMIDFYTKPCDKSRNFDYVEVLKTIKSKPSDWYINAADKYGLSKQKRRFIPCRKCHKAGHTERECKKGVVCYICGQFNHMFTRCPNTMCLTCGNRTPRNINCCSNCQKFRSTEQSCTLCGQRYHSEKLCPSKWRQHLILSDSNVPAKPNPRKFCYNCAAKGHFGFECPRQPYSNYPPENPIITSLLNCTSPSKNANDGNNSITAIINLYQDTTDRLKTEAGVKFLKNFSDRYKICVELFHNPRNYVKLVARREEIDAFRRQLNQWKKEVAKIILT